MLTVMAGVSACSGISRVQYSWVAVFGWQRVMVLEVLPLPALPSFSSPAVVFTVPCVYTPDTFTLMLVSSSAVMSEPGCNFTVSFARACSSRMLAGILGAVTVL